MFQSRFQRLLAAVAPAIGCALLAAFSLPATAAGDCPASNALGNFLASDKVGADFSVSGHTATYFFDSVNRNPVNGVPGLIAYCVYPGPGANPNSAAAVVLGANGAQWVVSSGPRQGYFAFVRPNGDPSNVPLDGLLDVIIGTATWTGAVPSAQTILLHINDAAECSRLYGGNPGTCFVIPALVPACTSDTPFEVDRICYCTFHPSDGRCFQ